MKQPLISVQDVHFTYPDGTKALFGASLDIYEGEMMAIVGQNGSGKTTLVKHFNGLLKPTVGDVLVEGISVKKQPLGQLAQKVGYVYQNPSLQLFCRSVRDEVSFGLKLAKVPPDVIKKRVEEVLDTVGLLDKIEEYPFFLTTGEKQRVAIAAVLSLNPSVLIVDEPTTGQDFKRAYQFMEIFERLNKEENKTIIFITHEMRFTTEFAQRTVVVNDGKVLLDGLSTQVFTQVEKLQEAFVTPPQITQLALQLGSLGIRPDILKVNELYAEIKKEYQDLKVG
ncbi:energy-coupling factor ABC transporter ATP-binding protein [Candidatus Formimonas warabiya]|uniref:ABC transporter domain-containing protein n=1 Tax=Formimonas warabiya TaxID=1761012 RepID=A0A3G1KTT5_FORW1|nr:energy-coupling factor ABC transporter ATP-binding protein [Candidatus Formimonas warabiya]ATW25878.1 hypothetical protein DCMF_14850 [Candidatus Formimonas warabiya]